jgi:CDP-paratose 2-epimerase
VSGFGGRPVLITGGAGFIGTNLADRLLTDGHAVIVYDNLARRGARENLAWLRARHGAAVEACIGDVREAGRLRPLVEGCGAVFHLAAQVAVTTSLDDPAEDFAINAGGTLTLLEALRRLREPPPLLFTSTNKVYGNLHELAVVEHDGRYQPRDEAVRARGINERQPLDFHSPYGCSKGSADQYVLDYARVFGLPAVVFRMSCIYGPHQHGTEDQGWVAHFLLRARGEEPITIYGDGRQVRDVLFAGDLVEAMLGAVARIEDLAGRAFNVGGGVQSAISLLELAQRLAVVLGREPRLEFGPWRAADQRYYVSDTSALAHAIGWRPQVGIDEGLRRMLAALRERDHQPSGAAEESGGEAELPPWLPAIHGDLAP